MIVNLVPNTASATQCSTCGLWHPGICPRIESIELRADGSKVITFRDQSPRMGGLPDLSKIGPAS